VSAVAPSPGLRVGRPDPGDPGPYPPSLTCDVRTRTVGCRPLFPAGPSASPPRGRVPASH